MLQNFCALTYYTVSGKKTKFVSQYFLQNSGDFDGIW